ncbi:hypothetical protein TWF191_000316 [Orbilia oligospora]|uniref:Alpha-L-arabinofuranosidase n=1 Tax=Orbilia oligospora TaxID=2813651 RepID=A0A7C8QZA9_ORBOL|nr:hypothetical protein TWF191_000316 [Orbilia oligospora]
MWSRPIKPFVFVLYLGAVLVTAGPCDIYASGNTPCVAAHATTRALYSAYTGALYQVKRAKDNAVADIKPISAGGPADSAAQDSFCSGTTCLISIIYDQSGHNNHLTQAPPGGFKGPAAGGYDNLASATAAPIYLNGRKVYGVFVAPGTGYRNNKATGTAKGDQAQGIYAVLDGTHYNGGCCFDYGNAEISSTDTGNGHMETIYFGNNKVWGTGAGNGPWIMADLENGLFSGVNMGNNAGNPSITWRGKRPNANGYNPMSKEGAIILGIGGDNSNGAAGTFYEGVMTSGYPTDTTENSVQADIVAARYSTTGGGTGTTTSAVRTTTSAGGSSGSCSSLYGQCGGIGWTGPTCCSSSTCTYSNPYYSQCL